MDFSDEPTPEEQQAALVAALKARMGQAQQQQPQAADFYRGWGNMNMRSGDRVLGALGQAQIGQANTLGRDGGGLLAALAKRRQRSEAEEELASANALLRRKQAENYGTATPAQELGLTKTRLQIEELQKKPGREGFKDSSDLRKEFLGSQPVKDMQIVAGAYEGMKAASANPSAAGDLSLIFSYMKLLDPGSTVREGEFANAQNAGGVDSKIMAQYNNILNGQRLTPDQRADFMGQAKNLFGAKKARFDPLAKQYKGLAEKGGLDPSSVVIDLGLDQQEAPALAPDRAARLEELRKKRAAGALK